SGEGEGAHPGAAVVRQRHLGQKLRNYHPPSRRTPLQLSDDRRFAASSPGRRSRHAIAPRVQFANRYAIHVRESEDRQDERLALNCAPLFDHGECQSMWNTSIRAVNKYLADKTPTGLWYGEADMNSGKRTATQFGALHAFLPAVLDLGGDTDRARRLQQSCFR